MTALTTAMSVSQLASVEIQLIMRSCDLHSLLAFAQCCHLTFAAASSRFAFDHLAPVPAHAAQPDLSALMRKSLLRFAPISLRLSSEAQADSKAVEWIETTGVRVRDLDVSARRRFPHELLPLRTFTDLHSLAFTEARDSSVLQIASSWPQLRRLRLHLRDRFPLLCPLTHLTELDVWYSGSSWDEHPQSLRGCAHLTHVTLRGLSSNGASVALQGCASVRHLVLSNLVWDQKPLTYEAAVGHAQWLGSLSLISLTLLCPPHRILTSIVAEVAAGSLSGLLTIQSNVAASIVPTVAEVTTLLERFPQLHLRLELWTRPPIGLGWGARSVAQPIGVHLAEQTRKLVECDRTVMKQLCAVAPTRVSVVLLQPTMSRFEEESSLIAHSTDPYLPHSTRARAPD